MVDDEVEEDREGIDIGSGNVADVGSHLAP